VLASESDKGIIQRNLAVFLEISALAQPVGEYFRQGLLAVAGGHLEQHLTLLEACAGGVPSPVLEGKSRISNLIDSTTDTYGPNFDPKLGFAKDVNYAVAVRNSVIHREGRIDQRFLSAVGRDSVQPEDYGKLLNMSVPSTCTYMSTIFGFATRASMFMLLSLEPGQQFSDPALQLAREVFRLRGDHVAGKFVSDITI
jgi:hypothetical protein